MRALQLSVVGEGVMRNCGIRTESCHLHIPDAAALPLVGLVLQILDEIMGTEPTGLTCDKHESMLIAWQR
jgi:hypothetical protein